MERAVIITDPPAQEPEGFDLVYYGAETCERLLPTSRKLSEALSAVSGGGGRLTLLTPGPVTDDGVGKIKKLLDTLSEFDSAAEVVFNDIGVLGMLSRDWPDLKPVLGRLLNKVKKDPRLSQEWETLPPEAKRHFSSTSSDNPAFRQFLHDRGVCRVEYDNIPQGLDLRDSAGGLKMAGSLYYPDVVISVTRMCLFQDKGVRAIPGSVISSCHSSCRGNRFSLSSSHFDRDLFLQGNAIMCENNILQDNLSLMGIDRLVQTSYRGELLQ